jgi:hypothetical protein
MALAVSGAASGSALNMSSGWLADTYTSIQNSKNAGGLIGMLDNARGDNSLKSYLKRTRAASNGFALIAQSGVANAGAFYSKLAQSGQQKLANERLELAFKDLERARNMVQKKNVLDPIIFFTNGSTLNTTSNILTMTDGKQYNSITGAEYVDPTYIIQMANGAYLDTKNNVLTMSDGTKIDTVTGLKVSVTA